MKKTFVLLIVIYGLIFFFSEKYKNTLINKELRSSVEVLKLNHDIEAYHRALDADTIYAFVNSNGYINQILKTANKSDETKKAILREVLYNKLLERFGSMNKRGVTILHFILKDGRSFLRMHKKEDHGDQLEQLRYSIHYVNKYHKSIRGLERGKLTYALRNVYPLFTQSGEYVGCVDVAHSTQAFQHNLETVNKIDTNLILKNIIINKDYEDPQFRTNYTDAIEHKEFYHLIKKEDRNDLGEKKHISKGIKQLSIKT